MVRSIQVAFLLFLVFLLSNSTTNKSGAVSDIMNGAEESCVSGELRRIIREAQGLFPSECSLQARHMKEVAEGQFGYWWSSVYDAFKHSGVTPSLLALIGSKALVCLLGVVLNLDMVLITWRTKHLRGACNLQIAVNAASMAIQESSAFVTLFVVGTGTNFIPLRTCAVVQALPLFCTIFTNGMALSIGVDRLVSVLFPVWYLNHDRRRGYLSLILALCSLYAAVVPAVALRISFANPQIPVMCTVIDPAQRQATWVVVMLLSVNCASVLCYLLVWALIWFRDNMKEKQVKVFKSLSFVLVLEICGWITNYVVRLVLGAANIHALDTWYLVNASTIAPYVSLSLSPVVLYAFSTEYSRAFWNQFPRTARVSPQGTQQQLQSSPS